jgi:hypothetical protein
LPYIKALKVCCSGLVAHEGASPSVRKAKNLEQVGGLVRDKPGVAVVAEDRVEVQRAPRSRAAGSVKALLPVTTENLEEEQRPGGDRLRAGGSNTATRSTDSAHGAKP